MDTGEPRRHPGDEDAREFVGPSDADQVREYNSTDEQGISNRPAKAEHAFPESGESRTETDAPDSVETTPSNRAEIANVLTACRASRFMP